MNTTRAYGVEMELADVRMSRGSEDVLGFLADSMNEAGVSAIVATDGSDDEPVGGRWKVLWDSTAGPIGGGGPELVSPPMTGHDGLAQVRRVCGVLDTLGATVNEHCGLHVHHDAGDMTTAQMMRVSTLYQRHQETISALLHPSRRNNAYAMPMTEEVHDPDAVRSVGSLARPFERLRVSRAMSGNDRHRAVNWLAYACHGTVEFRQHHATIDAREIIYWMLLTQAIVDAAVGDADLRKGWPRLEPDDGPSRREALMWADLDGQVSGDPHYGEMRSHYRRARLAA